MLLTEPQQRTKLGDVRRADVNRARKIQAIRELSRLLDEATEVSFTGTVGVEVSGKTGSLGNVCVKKTCWPAE